MILVDFDEQSGGATELMALDLRDTELDSLPKLNASGLPMLQNLILDWFVFFFFLFF